MSKATVRQIAALADALRLTKKRVIEEAVGLYAQSLSPDRIADPLGRNFGAWARSEPATRTVEKARAAFRQFMERRKR